MLIDTIDNHFIPLEHWPWDDPPESVINFNPAEYPGDVQKKLRRNLQRIEIELKIE